MTREFHEDMETLLDTGKALDPAKQTGPKITDSVDKYRHEAIGVQNAIKGLRDLLQPSVVGKPTPDEVTLGLWAAGLGQHPMSDHNKLRDVLDNGAAASAGITVDAFCEYLKGTEPSKQKLLSLIDAALAEDDEYQTGNAGPLIPPGTRTKLEQLRVKIDQMAQVKLFIPPPYLWPSTYVSSSSSSGYSSSSWPPGPF